MSVSFFIQHFYDVLIWFKHKVVHNFNLVSFLDLILFNDRPFQRNNFILKWWNDIVFRLNFLFQLKIAIVQVIIFRIL